MGGLISPPAAQRSKPAQIPPKFSIRRSVWRVHFLRIFRSTTGTTMCSSRVPLSLYRRGTDSCSIGFAEHVSSSGLGSLPVGFGVPPAESFSLFRLFASVSVFLDNTYTLNY